MNSTITTGLVVLSAGVFLILVGKAFRRRRGMPVVIPEYETDEEWRARMDRQEAIIDEMERRRKELDERNQELVEFKRLAEENENRKAGYYYYLKGLAKAEQAEAAAVELEALIARYDAEYGTEDVEV